jgi:uncharacterized protein (DUF433 family)
MAASGKTRPFARITIDPNRMGGMPCIRDTRVTVSAVLCQLAAGRSASEILGDYPYLEPADIPAALEYGAAAVANELRWDGIEASLGAIEDRGHEWDADPAAWVRAGRRANAQRVG